MGRLEALTEGAEPQSRFERLYRAHHREVLAYCMRRTNRADAEEVASEVFAVAWRRIDDLPSGDRALPWLYGVARKTLANRWRANRRRRNLVGRLEGLGVDAPTPPDVVVLQRLENRLAQQALARLNERDQEVLRLATWEKLSQRDIGAVLGVSEQAVAQRVSRARRRLAREFDRLQVVGKGVTA